MNQKRAWLGYEEEINRKKDIDKDTALAQKAFDDKKKKIDDVTKELNKLENSIKDIQTKLNEAVSIETNSKKI